MAARIVLARNVHAGAEQAQKLEALIEEADIISFETAFMPIKIAVPYERAFSRGKEDRLQALIDASRRLLKERYDRKAAYENKLYELLGEYHREVVLIERLSEADLAAIADKYESIERYEQRGNEAVLLGNILLGNIDTATKLEMEYLKDFSAIARFRDRKIIEYAPTALRKAKQRAGGKKDMTYLVILGRLHAIAQDLADQTNVSVEDVLLPGSVYHHLSVGCEIRRLVHEGRDDEATRAIPLRLMESSLRKLLIVQEQLMQVYTAIAIEQSKKMSKGRIEEIPENRIDELVDDYVLNPLCSNIARQVSPEQAREYVSRLGRLGRTIFEEVSRGEYRKWSSVTFDFLREVGIAISEKGDLEMWKALFPFGQEESQEIVRTMYHPRAKV